MSERPVHSPLGASSAERWLHCPGSVGLLKTLELPETDEPDYRKNGTAAHQAASHCLENTLDAWEVVGQEFNGVEVDVGMADAIQVYLDAARPLMEAAAIIMIEQPIQFDEHESGYGTVDLLTIDDEMTMDVTDYKHGEGIIVEPEWNPQLMYYAYGEISKHPDIRRVNLRIVQPRGFHVDGPVRVWETTAETIAQWAQETLIPAMHAVELDHSLDPGSHCRFCPAKLVCPMLTSLFGAASTADPETVINLNDESLGRSYQYVQGVKFYLKALEEEVYRRLNLGGTVPGTKLVTKKANRVFKDGAESLFREHFGQEAFEPGYLKSPAEMAKIGPKAKALVSEWAYQPQTGLTVALDDDKRVGVKVQKTAEVFKDAVANLAAE